MTDWDGIGYGQISDLQRTMAERSLSRLTLNGDEECLDVGCGDGYISRLVAVRVPNGSVLGVDASPRMIQAALAAPIPPGATLLFEPGNVLTLTLENAFDLVYTFNTLHWVVDQRTALHALGRAVRPGGRVVVQYVCSGPRPSIESVAMEVSSRPAWQSAFTGFQAPYVHVDPSTYDQLAQSAGLVLQNVAVHDEEWDFGSREAFVRWCTVGLTDWTTRIPADQVPTWVDEVVDRYQEVVGQPGLFRFLQLFAELTPADRSSS